VDRRHATENHDDGKSDNEGDNADIHENQPRAGQAPLLGVTMGEEQDRSGREKKTCNSQCEGSAHRKEECKTRRRYCPNAK
jgi:hypothetical protein